MSSKHRSVASSSTIYLGLDVHKDSITVAVLPSAAAVPTRVERLPNDLVKLRRLLARLAREGDLWACYEASGAGYVLHRALEEWGYRCEVIAPSLIPKRPGVQRKHDKRDAIELARLLRAGELTAVRIPSAPEERVRDLVRCRETFQRELLKSRHYILKFLARRGFVYRDGAHWSRGHMTWLHAFAARDTVLQAEDAIVFREYFALLEYKLARRVALDTQIEALAVTPPFATPTGWLQCFRGVKAHSAMVLTTEIVDWRRFETPRQLMAYLGFVPREHSSGPRERRGGITKAGNSHCRHVLLQAAWSYRHPAQIGTSLKARQRGQPAAVIAHAWQAQHRLHKRYHHLAHRKPPQVAVVAVARELIGFLWAVMRELEPRTPIAA